MFSYRHAFHAGNHGDVLKHIVLINVLQYLTQKDTPLSVVDTHAGVGLYRLDGDFAQTSQESNDGVFKLYPNGVNPKQAPKAQGIADYMELLARYNPGMADGGKLRIYPGSPFITQELLRPQDKLHLFELHPTDMRSLKGNIEQLNVGKKIQIWHEDSFADSLRLLPPPSRRGLVLCDPSYELKSDYGQVSNFIAAALKKFATGVYMVWYPIIPRTEAHDLPRRLKTLARQSGRNWLNATLSVKSASMPGIHIPGEKSKRPGMAASGVFIINPPFALNASLKDSLPELAKLLGQDHLAGFKIEAGGAS